MKSDRIKSWPSPERPRERLLTEGPEKLTEAEKVGITATGEADTNELYPNDNLPPGVKPEDSCVELYRRFRSDPAAFLKEAKL